MRIRKGTIAIIIFIFIFLFFLFGSSDENLENSEKIFQEPNLDILNSRIEKVIKATLITDHGFGNLIFRENHVIHSAHL